MALALNTSHPLYSYLKMLIGVDSDNLPKDLITTSRTVTKDAAATNVTGTWGRAIRSVANGSAKGIILSPAYLMGGANGATVGWVATEFIAINGVTGCHTNLTMGQSFAATTSESTACGVAIMHPTTKAIGLASAANVDPDTFGSYPSPAIDLRDGAAHTLCIVNSNPTGSTSGMTSTLYVDGVSKITTTGKNAWNAYRTRIGGGGYNAVAADFVWAAYFNKALTDAEVLSLHQSLGANNTFGLVQAPGTDVTGTGANVTGTASISTTGATAQASVSASGATLAGTSGISTTGATGLVGGFATAPGCDLTGTSSISTTGATGQASASASGATLTGTAAIATAGASVIVAAPGQITTEAMVNNTGTLLIGQAISWTWWQGGIGSAPTSLTHGFGVTGSDATFTATGLPAGAGFLLVTDAGGDVFYQPGTVT